MKLEIIELRKLIADRGMVLNKGDTYEPFIYLGEGDVPENWNEIPESEVPKEETIEEIIE